MDAVTQDTHIRIYIARSRNYKANGILAAHIGTHVDSSHLLDATGVSDCTWDVLKCRLVSPSDWEVAIL